MRERAAIGRNLSRRALLAGAPAALAGCASAPLDPDLELICSRAVNLDAFEFPHDWRRDIVEAAAPCSAGRRAR